VWKLTAWPPQSRDRWSRVVARIVTHGFCVEADRVAATKPRPVVARIVTHGFCVEADRVAATKPRPVVAPGATGCRGMTFGIAK